MSGYKMQGLPMRRGLSPEGQEIRARHQGSLMIGSTTPFNPSDDVSLERAMNRGKIDVGQFHSPKKHLGSSTTAGPQPVRAMYHPTTMLDIDDAPKVNSLPPVRPYSGRNFKQNERNGSAHSDYFSLSDEPLDISPNIKKKNSLDHDIPSAYNVSPSHSFQKGNNSQLNSEIANTELRLASSVNREQVAVKPAEQNHNSDIYDLEIGSSQNNIDGFNSQENLGNDEKLFKTWTIKPKLNKSVADENSNQELSIQGDRHESMIDSGDYCPVQNSVDVKSINSQQDEEARENAARGKHASTEAITVIGEGLDRRKLIQKYKNQELSTDNPLHVNHNEGFNDECFYRRRGSFSSSPRLKPITSKKTWLSPQKNKRELNLDQINNPVSDATDNGSSFNEYLKGTESIAKIQNVDNFNTNSSTPRSPDHTECPGKEQIVGPDSVVSQQNCTRSLKNSNDRLRETYTLPNSNKCTLQINDSDDPLKATYTISSLTNVQQQCNNEGNNLRNNEHTSNFSRSSSLQSLHRNESGPQMSKALCFHPGETYTVNDIRSIGSSSPDIPGTVSQQMNYKSRKFSPYESSVNHSTGRAVEYQKDNILGRLQSGSYTKLIPATLSKPSDFTRSLRNNSSQSQRNSEGRSHPLRATTSIYKFDDRISSTNASNAVTTIDLRKNKVSDVISKIKEKKPTCDADFQTVKRSIERQHVSMFARDGKISRASSIGSVSSVRDTSTSEKLTSRSSNYHSRNMRSRSVDRSVQRIPSAAPSNCSSQNISRVQRLGSIESLSSKRSDVESKVWQPTSKNSTERKANSVKSKTSVQITRLRNSRTANMIRNKSNFNLNENIDNISSETNAKVTVPKIDLQGVNQTTQEEIVHPVHDSLASYNFSHDNEASTDAVKIPLKIPDDSQTSDSCDDLSNNFNTLELNLPQKNKTQNAEKQATSQCGNDITSASGSISSKDDNKAKNYNLPECSNLDKITEVSSAESALSSVKERADIESIDKNMTALDGSHKLDEYDLNAHHEGSDVMSMLQQNITKKRERVNPEAAKPFSIRQSSQARSKNVTSSRQQLRVDKDRQTPSSSAGVPPPTYKRGEVPKYLRERREEERRQKEIDDAKDPACPPDHTPLPEHQRIHTLKLLHDGIKKVLQEISSLPVAQDTLRVRRRKQELEEKLEQLEDGVKIFSQPKVYVLNDEDDQSSS